MRYLTVNEVLEIHSRIIQQSGGAGGVHNLGILESALAVPRMTFAGEDLYPAIVDKASALGFSLIQNHPFIDGNKRVGHAAMEIFLILNGFEIRASIDEQERVILSVASGELRRDVFKDWLTQHIEPISLEDR
jgi:death on curing protein